MDVSYSMGGLIPLWILGAPLLAAGLSLATTPKVSRSESRDARVPQPSHPPLAATGLSMGRA